MTRLALCSALCGLAVVLALGTAVLQSRNRERGIALDVQKEECDMLEAVNGERCERILAQDWRPLPHEPAGVLGRPGAPGKPDAKGGERLLAKGRAAP
jgi:hypothetical protein